MLKYILAIVILAQFGCVEDGRNFTPIAFKADDIQLAERLKREMLQLEDLTIGKGPVAAAGRRVVAEITVRYRDGTLVYRGPMVTYLGMIETGFIDNSPLEPSQLSPDQIGIVLGLNGMAVGGNRRMTIAPNLVCYEITGRDITKGENPGGTCLLVRSSGQGKDGAKVRKVPLIVDTTLTAVCRPVTRRIGPFYLSQGCGEVNVPDRQPSDPIWRFYHILPNQL